ncbi:hypothetical protein HK104_005209 [Borealophlyctis nickersoniae]|nr:hypothetical protein HK104_005209 [Borealophlyctis nickersoniae]
MCKPESKRIECPAPAVAAPARVHGSAEEYEEFNHTIDTDTRFADLEPERLTEWWRVGFWDQHKGHPHNALLAVERTLKWRKEYGWYTLLHEDFSAECATGKLYFHGRDEAGNPVLVWRFSRHRGSGGEPVVIERTVRFVVWTMAKAIEEGLIKKQATFLMDRVDATSENAEGVAFIRALIQTLQVNMPEVVYKMCIFPSNLIIWSVWKLAKPFLDPKMVNKVAICGSGEYKKVLAEFIPDDQLAKRYGGSSRDPYDEVGGGDSAVDLSHGKE